MLLLRLALLVSGVELDLANRMDGNVNGVVDAEEQRAGIL
jgi:hypothetical protein